MNTIRKAIVGGTIVASTLAGGAIGAMLVGTAGAQTAADNSTSTTQVTPTDPNANATTPPPGRHGGPGGFDPAKGGHVGTNGVKEELLTGDTATKVTAAAQAAVPGGTIERVETDAEGSPYEAHMRTSDGKEVTVKVDASFNVTSTEDGPR